MLHRALALADDMAALSPPPPANPAHLLGAASATLARALRDLMKIDKQEKTQILLPMHTTARRGPRRQISGILSCASPERCR
jgi:hypothetical protein